VGPRRTPVVVGSAPLFAATLAILLLDEPFEWPLAIGALLIVGAGIVLAAETVRPAHFRLLGIAFALTATVLFSTRDLAVRTVVSPLVATESLWGVLLAALVLRRSELVGPRLVLGAALVVAGGALIGAFR